MRYTSVLAAAALLVTFGCGGDGGSVSGPSGQSGNLNIRITDAPFGSAKAVLVTFSELAAHRTDSNGSKVSFPSGDTWTCDLKKLENNAQDVLGIANLSSGQYTMIRLVVRSAKIFFDSSSTSATPCARTIAEPAGAVFPLNIPSGEVKLLIPGGFTLTDTGATTILLDFDGAASITETGNKTYVMNPVVKLRSVQ